MVSIKKSLVLIALGCLFVPPPAAGHTLRQAPAERAVERHMTRNRPAMFENERITGERVGACEPQSRHLVRCLGEYAIAYGRDRKPSEFCGGTYIAALRGRTRRISVVPSSGFEWDFACYDRPITP